MRRFFFCSLLLPALLFGRAAPLPYPGPLFPEHSLIVSENSAVTLNWIYELAGRAEQSLEVGLYSSGGKAFRKLLEIVEERMGAKPLLKTTFLTAAYLLEEEDYEWIARVKEKFPDRFFYQYTQAHFNPDPDYCSNECHIKMIVVDEKYYIVGGTNLHEACCTVGDEENHHLNFHVPGMPRGTRDMDVVGCGPVAKELRELFYRLVALWEEYERSYTFSTLDSFEKTRYFPLGQTRRATLTSFDNSASRIAIPEPKLLVGTPSISPNPITQEYEKVMESATQEIVMGCFYFNPVPSLFTKLYEALQKNVSVTVITNGLWEKAPDYLYAFSWANRINYFPFFLGREAKVGDHNTPPPPHKGSILEFRVPDVLYHKKVMVVDRHLTLIGSYNLNPKSDYGDFEIALLIDSDRVANECLKVLEKDQQLSEKITYDQARSWYYDTFFSYRGALQKLFQGFL